MVKIALGELLQSTRVKIIELFFDGPPEMLYSDILRTVGMSHKSGTKHLYVLVKYGILIEKRYGQVKVYCLNPNNPITKHLQKAHYLLGEKDHGRPN